MHTASKYRDGHSEETSVCANLLTSFSSSPFPLAIDHHSLSWAEAAGLGTRTTSQTSGPDSWLHPVVPQPEIWEITFISAQEPQ